MPQRPSSVRLSAAGFSPWIPVDRYVSSFGVGFGVSLSNGATLTYSVQHVFDDIYERFQGVSITRSGTTATLVQTDHGLSAGDWIYTIGFGAPLDGFFSVASVVDADTLTYTVANSGATAGAATGWLQKGRVFTHTDVASETISMDGNYQFPPRACRLLVSAYTDGFADLTVINAGK